MKSILTHTKDHQDQCYMIMQVIIFIHISNPMDEYYSCMRFKMECKIIPQLFNCNTSTLQKIGIWIKLPPRCALHVMSKSLTELNELTSLIMKLNRSTTNYAEMHFFDKTDYFLWHYGITLHVTIIIQLLSCGAGVNNRMPRPKKLINVLFLSHCTTMNSYQTKPSNLTICIIWQNSNLNEFYSQH